MASKIPVTEVASLGLKPGIDLADKSSSAHQVIQDALNVLSRQAGFQRAHYGQHLEDPTILDLVIGA